MKPELREKIIAYNKGVAQKAEKATDLDKYAIYIMNGACPQDRDRVVAKLQFLLPEAKIIPQFIGPVIGSHCGPGTIAIIFVGPNRPEPIEE